MKYLNTIILGAFIIVLAFFFAIVTVKSTGKYEFELSAGEMLNKVINENQFLALNEAYDRIRNEENYVFVDIRPPREFITYHLPGAINIPYERLLDDDFEPFFKNNETKILYGASVSNANASWMLLTQYGYQNIAVLEGDVTDWKQHVDNEDVFKDKFKSNETPRFNFKEIIEGSNI